MRQAKILIVEDELIVAKDLEFHLKRMGHSVIAKVTRGEDAVEIAAAQHPDLILMDIVLKGELDGIETSYRIRKSSDIPIIFVTAYTEDSVFERAKATGPYAYIIKPVDMVELKITVELVLYRRYIEDKKTRIQHKLKESLDRCLPICATCKRIRDEHGHWEQLESYITEHYQLKFSHGLCPECASQTLNDIENYRK